MIWSGLSWRPNVSKYNVTLSRRADNLLIAHTEFLARVSVPAARRLLAEFRKVSGVLEETPFQYPFADELDVPGIPPETYRKCVFGGRYKAIFLIEGNEVLVDAIIDCRQENKNLFEEDS
jgi:plasmid stabilization system protein ParE